MKKTIVSAIIIGVFALYCFLHAQAAIVPTTPATARTPSGAIASATAAPSPPPQATDTPGATATTTTTGRYKDGTYTGSEADAQWGIVQVKAVIQNGRLVNVQFLQYPNERDRSVEINSYADPQLINEALQVQSAQVDIVSGATDTSQAFMQSLSDALSQAQA